MKTFPQPLTAEEENQVLERWENSDQEARDILIERNMRLVAYVAKKYITSERDCEDLISIGTIGLIKAVNTYNRNKGSKLATYAAKCIDNEILMVLRMEKKYNKEVSLSAPIGTDKEGNAISLVDVLETDDIEVIDRVIDSEDLLYMNQAITSTLKPKEREVLMLRYGLHGRTEMTQREIAKRMDISRSYVSRIEKKALEKLRRELEKISR